MRYLLLGCLFFFPTLMSAQFDMIDDIIGGEEYTYMKDSLIVDRNHHIGYRFYQFDSIPRAEYYFHADKNKYHCRHYEQCLPGDEAAVDENPLIKCYGEIMYGPEYWVENDTVVIFNPLLYEEKVKIRRRKHRAPIRIGFWVERNSAGNYDKGFYQNGRRDGVWTIWDIDDVLLASQWYTMGKLLKDSTHNVLVTNKIESTRAMLCNRWELAGDDFTDPEELFVAGEYYLGNKVANDAKAYTSTCIVLYNDGRVEITDIAEEASGHIGWIRSKKTSLGYIYQKNGTFKLMDANLLKLVFDEKTYTLRLEFLSANALRFSFSE
jgi:hypothetical protein